MRYITKDDLLDNSYEQFIRESSKDSFNIINSLELKSIDLAKTYLTRYDTDSIFGIPIIDENENEDEDIEFTPPIRHELLAEIIAKITLYKLFRRNAARKVPEDIKEDYQWAIKELERIRSGAAELEGLPPKLDEAGNIASNSLWGNTTNKDFYI